MARQVLVTDFTLARRRLTIGGSCIVHVQAMKLPRLRERRERALLTQQELAARAGVSRAAISVIEAQKAEPQFSTIRKLADALGCEPKDLMEPEA
jgi:DNA-binding XRE family transcriptional regulator